MAESRRPVGQYQSLQRGLQILQIVQDRGRMLISEVSEELGIPLSTVYRYATVLKQSGFALEIDGYLIPGERLTEHSEHSPHLVSLASTVLKRLRVESGMSAVLAVRVNITAMCLAAELAHPRHRVSFSPGVVRSLYAGATALPLLAHAPDRVVRELLETELRPYTNATLTPEIVAPYLEQVRREGFAVSYGQVTPGMTGVGVPVLLDGKCLCSLSLVGGEYLGTDGLDQAVTLLKQGATELVARLPTNTRNEIWVGSND
ncbi:IclR family transcriptional regulator [Leucobacter ruminantium]|uniref:IclR family transcriptional regulator n=1 Tax=Leucobacter ruminantium TaxID=1289170 RepID=A0A939LTK1_9MICO|nr:IclR family transcriptional regulator [Leucobacter ruminantium]MBO1804565.1 IclR family transcriptional regulator [Leucobacter ruminantium]